MENQHRKITGYRELTQHEIDLMNAIKAKGAELLALQKKLLLNLTIQRKDLEQRVARLERGVSDDYTAAEDNERFRLAEPERWAALGKTDIQTGVMALVRAVAQPTEGC